MDENFSNSTLFKLNLYFDIREIKPLRNPWKTPDPKGQGFVEGQKVLTLTLTLLTLTPDPWRVDKPLHITNCDMFRMAQDLCRHQVSYTYTSGMNEQSIIDMWLKG